MRIYRVLIYRRGNLELQVDEQAGELIDCGSSRDWHRRRVLTDSGSGFEWTPDWMPSRREAIELAIRQVETAQANGAAVLDDLRNRLLGIEHRPLPAEVAVVSHGESAAGGRDVTPAGQARRTDPPVEA